MRQKFILGLFMAHRGALIDYANGIVGNRAQAEDLVQEAWMRLDETAKGRLLDQPLGYLYRIIRNLALDLTRRRSVERRQEDGEQAWWMLPAPPRTPEEETLHRRDLAVLEQTLATMPANMRLAVRMHRFDGFTLDEVARRLGVSPATAHRLVHDGLAHAASRLTGGHR